MFKSLSRVFTIEGREKEFEKRLEDLRKKLPPPLFWLFGKTQSGKTSIIKYLTGAEKAEIGRGFRPCTHFSMEYHFPTEETPLLSFLDTRGIDEPGYDPQEDLKRFNEAAQVILVTVKVLDHAQENILRNLRIIRKAQPKRPIILVLTCLHEAYPQLQHPFPYPFEMEKVVRHSVPIPPADLVRSIEEQIDRFGNLVDRVVLIDLTTEEDGLNDPNYGGPLLRKVLVESLPQAMGQTLLALDQATGQLQDLFAAQTHPYILGYASLAGAAGTLPVPILDLVLLSGIQTRMIYHLARIYGQPLTAGRFVELASTLGLGILARSLGRSLVKAIPMVGTSMGAVAGGALAWVTTYALGKAFCYYYRAVHLGHIPQAADLKKYYQEQIIEAQNLWNVRSETPPGKAPQRNQE